MVKHLIFFIFVFWGTAFYAQSKPESGVESESEGESAEPAEKVGNLPIDVRMKRVILRYKSQVAFFMPEGEFNASLEKKIGEFTSIARADYNFLRGEMGFLSQNIYTKYRFVPQVTAYDKLRFVPILEDGKTWRREQGIVVGGRLLFPLPANSMTSMKYIRYSSPSEENLQEIKLEKAALVSQTIAGEVDSLKKFGFVNGGILEFQIDRTLPVRADDLDYAQIHVRGKGQAVGNWFSVNGEISFSTLIDGDYAPPRFLGGRNKLSGFSHNEFAGLNSAFLGVISTVNLRRKARPIFLGVTVHDIALRMYFETGQVGTEEEMQDVANYHHSIGAGVVFGNIFRGRHSWELFFSGHQAINERRAPKFYFGIKL